MQQNKAKKSEDLDHLESWHKQRSATGFRVGNLHLTLKPWPLEASELATQFQDRILVCDHKTTITKQDRSIMFA